MMQLKRFAALGLCMGMGLASLGVSGCCGSEGAGSFGKPNHKLPNPAMIKVPARFKSRNRHYAVVKAGPSPRTRQLGRVAEGVQVMVLVKSGMYYQVELNGDKGWVHLEFIDFDHPGIKRKSDHFDKSHHDDVD